MNSETLRALSLDHLYQLRQTLAHGSASRQEVEAEISRREEEIQSTDFFPCGN